MSDYTMNLIKAIESGDKEQMDNAFSSALEAKRDEALQARKIELANSIYNNTIQQSDEQSDDATETEASGDGSEEV